MRERGRGKPDVITMAKLRMAHAWLTQAAWAKSFGLAGVVLENRKLKQMVSDESLL